MTGLFVPPVAHGVLDATAGICRLGLEDRSMQRTGPQTAIHNVADLGEDAGYRAVVAAVLQLAITDAKGGDRAAAVWLGSDECFSWLAWIAPEHTSAEALQRVLIARLPSWMQSIARSAGELAVVA